MIFASAAKNAFLVYGAIAILFIGAYTEIGFSIGGGYIPSFFSILFCCFAYYIIKPPFLVRDVRWMTYWGLFLLLSSLLAPNFSDIGSRFIGVLQAFIAFLTFIVTIRILAFAGTDVLSKFSIWMLRIIFLLTVAEYLGITTELSEYFRQVVYINSNYSLYDADFRDLGMGSSIRPKVFTTEPSLVAIGFFVLVVGVSSSVKSFIILFEAVIYIFLQYYILNSPIVLLSLLAFLWIVSYRFGFVAYGFVIMLSVAVFVFYGDVINERVQRFSFDNILGSHVAYDVENEKSERLRLVYPYMAVMDVFNVNPFTGLGISGKRSLELYSTVSPVYQIAFGNNAFATVFIYFGIGGAIVFFGIMYLFLKPFFVNWLVAGVVVFMFMQTMGGFETVRFWIYLGFVFYFLSNSFVALPPKR